jgi:broad specificity phosphatase PhoE
MKGKKIMTNHVLYPEVWELVRHGESDAQYARRVLGCAYHGDENPPLSALGRSQAAAAGRARKGTPAPDVVISSGLGRAYETAVIFCEAAGWKIPVIKESAFNEQSYGLMAHLSEAEQAAQFPEEFQRKFQGGFWFFQPPEGESWLNVHDRMKPAVKRVRRKYAGKHVMLFGHSSGNQVLRLLIEGLTVEQLLAIDLRQSKNCSITTYVKDGDTMKLKAAYYRPDELIALDPK